MKARKSEMIPVALSRLAPGSVAPVPLFLFLPRNDRMVPVFPRGDTIAPELFEALRLDGHSELWAFRSDEAALEAGASYRTPAAEHFGDALHETEEDEFPSIATSLAREIFSSDAGNFDELAGKAAGLADEALRRAGDSELLAAILEARRSQGPRRHSVLVGSLAALFAAAAGDWQLAPDLVVASAFHDVGLALVPQSVARQNASDRGPGERAVYEEHVAKGIAALELAEEPISSDALRMIREHHERADGKGFPAGLRAPQMFRGTHYLALADAFEELCRSDSSLDPRDALRKLMRNGPASAEILRSLEVALFPEV